MRALLIDDSKTMRGILARLLQPLGYTTCEAGDGQDGLDRLEDSGPFDLVIVDWNMPILTGIEFIAEVRAQKRHAELRIMVVSSQTEIDRIGEALESGADEFLMKPFDRDSLIGKLELLDLPVE